LAATLASPVRNSALLTFDLAGPPGKTVGMGMLEGANGLWRLRPLAARDDRGPLVEVQPTDGATLARLVREFVKSTTSAN
jgi:hypothetical protein